MKKYLEQIRLFIFELLITSIFKISKNFRLIRFERIEQNGLVDYRFIIRTNKDIADSNVMVNLLNYLKEQKLIK